jgi:hypothetical protein
MKRPPHPCLGVGLLLALAGCSPDLPASGAVALGSELQSPTGDMSAAWRSSEAVGVALRASADTLKVATGPHTVLWPAGGAALRPPYSVEATFHKRAGRLYEGYGIVFGAESLDRPETEQTYSYVLLRGDGAYLVKLREREETPVVQSWTAHEAIRRDREGVGQPNTLRVEVDSARVRIVVNGVAVGEVGSEVLQTAGLAGLRIAHDVEVTVSGFAVRAGPQPRSGP